VSEVEDCFFVAGDNAFVVKVRVPDVAGLESTIGRLQRVKGVALTRTTVVLSTKWEHRVVPLPPAETRPGSGSPPPPTSQLDGVAGAEPSADDEET
jgi:Lrp/AsnC family leucine-responsive transcriptional regulator